MSLEDLLNHGSHRTGDQRHGGPQHSLAEIEKPEEAIKGIVELTIGSGGVKSCTLLRPVINCSNGQRLLTRIMVKECALRDACFGAYLVNSSGRIALLGYGGYSCPEKLLTRISHELTTVGIAGRMQHTYRLERSQ